MSVFRLFLAGGSIVGWESVCVCGGGGGAVLAFSGFSMAKETSDIFRFNFK